MGTPSKEEMVRSMDSEDVTQAGRGGQLLHFLYLFTMKPTAKLPSR